MPTRLGLLYAVAGIEGVLQYKAGAGVSSFLCIRVKAWGLFDAGRGCFGFC